MINHSKHTQEYVVKELLKRFPNESIEWYTSVGEIILGLAERDDIRDVDGILDFLYAGFKTDNKK